MGLVDRFASIHSCAFTQIAAAITCAGIAGWVSIIVSFRFNVLRKDASPKRFALSSYFLPWMTGMLAPKPLSQHKALFGSSSIIKMDSHDHIEKVLLNEDVTHLHVLIDFDLTLTSHDSKQCHDTLLNYELMPKAFVEEMEKMLDFSKPNPITQGKPASYWWEYISDLLIAHRITEQQLNILLEEESKHIKLRNGANELLRELHRLHVPVTIVSAGFVHVIEEVLRLENIPMDNIKILSNKLLFDNDVCAGSYPSPPLYSQNKHTAYELLQAWFEGEAEAAKTATGLSSDDTHRRLLVIGDSVGDVQAAENVPSSSTLKVGFYRESHWHGRDEFEEVYDVILPVEESFHWLTNELRRNKYTKRTIPPKEK